jgi:hypothetical protein
VTHTIGDGPIEQRFFTQMQAIASVLDERLNPGLPQRPRKTGFVLLVFPFGSVRGRCNYISNAAREDVVTMLKEQLAYFEGMPSVEGRG